MKALAQTTFTCGPDDNLATVDVYSQAGETPINNLPDISQLIDINNLSKMQGGDLLDEMQLNDMIQGLDATTGQLKVNSDSLLKGILASNSELMSSLKSLSSGMQTDLLNSDLMSKISGTFNGISGEFFNADLGSLKGLAGMINQLACANLPFSFSDISGMISLITNLIKNGIRAGLDGIFAAFANCPKVKQEVLHGVALGLKPFLLSSGNNNLLLDIARSTAGPYLYSNSPGFFGEYLNSYNSGQSGLYRQIDSIFGSNLSRPKTQQIVTNRPTMTNTQYYQEYNKINEAFTLMNPNWNNKPASYTSLTNPDPQVNRVIVADTVVGSSVDFIRTLQAGVDGKFITVDVTNPQQVNTADGTSYEAYMLLVRNTPRSNVRPILKEEFPYSAVKVYEG